MAIAIGTYLAIMINTGISTFGSMPLILFPIDGFPACSMMGEQPGPFPVFGLLSGDFGWAAASFGLKICARILQPAWVHRLDTRKSNTVDR
jgi:hypothetical protein